jgi:hypothetical protein
MNKLHNLKLLAAIAFVAISGCDGDDEIPSLRPKIDYSLATTTTSYGELFVDGTGTSTVNLAEGNNRLKMFQALNYHSTSAISANTQIDADKLASMFANTGNPFVNISTSTISVVGADLNASGVQLKDVVASSLSTNEAEAVRARIESLFNQIEIASNAVTTPASQGVAGKLGSYLVDAKGIELAQVIQKSLIGALQLDYIGNVLLDEGLTAENHKVDGDDNYTELEHNWDVSYGLLTLNPIYLANSTNDTRGTVEFGAGSYIWEYNKANYANIYPAFLRGRIAIVNNDKAEYREQAEFIRTEIEKTIANAALGYLDKWKQNPTNDAARAHAFAEGLGFIYSLRFATLHGADATFSDGIITTLTNSPNGFWDLTTEKINTASEAIKTKFGL